MTDALTPRLKTRYQNEIRDALQKEFTRSEGAHV